jgi:hypothetical protein
MEQTETRGRLEFDLFPSDDLPLDGTHCVGRVHEGRGTIVHSHECTEADLAALRSMLEADLTTAYRG